MGRPDSRPGARRCRLREQQQEFRGGGGGSTTSNKSGKPILVGAAVALTGDEAPFDEPPMQAFQQAAAEVNAQGGINGRPLKVVVRDMKSDASLASRVTTDLVNQGAELVLTPCDPDLGAPGAIVAQQKGIISFSLCEASARFGPQGIGKYVYTPSHITYLEGYVMAEWAQMRRNFSRAFVIEDKTFAGYDGEVCKGFRNRWGQLGGKTVGSDTLSADDKSIASTVTRIKSANPEFVYMCSQPPGSPGWIRQIRAAGLNMPILLATATDGNYWLKAVPHLNDVFYPSMGSIYGDDPNPRVNTFVEEFTKKQGHPPQTAYALFGGAVHGPLEEGRRTGQDDRCGARPEGTGQLPQRGHDRGGDHVHGHRPHRARPADADHGGQGRQDPLQRRDLEGQEGADADRVTSSGPEAGGSVRTDDALAAEDVTVAFSGVKALDGVTFLCRPGEIVGLIGPNGSGKTTLLNALSGFLEPASGTVRFCGEKRADGRPSSMRGGAWPGPSRACAHSRS